MTSEERILTTEEVLVRCILNKEEIKHLLALHSLLLQSFEGAIFGNFQVDGGRKALSKILDEVAVMFLGEEKLDTSKGNKS